MEDTNLSIDSEGYLLFLHLILGKDDLKSSFLWPQIRTRYGEQIPNKCTLGFLPREYWVFVFGECV